MRNLIFLIVLALVGFLIAGYFLDWYDIKGLPGGEGNTRLQIDIHTSKIRDDIDRGGDKLKDGIDRVRDSAEKPDSAEKKDATAKVDAPSAKKTAKGEGSFFEFLDRIGEKVKPPSK